MPHENNTLRHSGQKLRQSQLLMAFLRASIALALLSALTAAAFAETLEHPIIVGSAGLFILFSVAYLMFKRGSVRWASILYFISINFSYIGLALFIDGGGILSACCLLSVLFASTAIMGIRTTALASVVLLGGLWVSIYAEGSGLVAFEHFPPFYRATVQSIILLFVLYGLYSYEKYIAHTGKGANTCNRQPATVDLDKQYSYREIFEASQDAIFLHNADNGSILDVNEAAQILFGYEKPEMLKLNLTQLSSIEEGYEQDHIHASLAKCRDQGSAVFDWRSRAKDGHIFWTEVRLKSVVLGGQRCIIATVRNIDHAKKAQDELKSKVEELDHFFENSMDMLCVSNALGYIIRINSEWTAVLGYTVEELKRRLLLDLIHPDDVASTKMALEHATYNKLHHFENRYRHKDGSYRWIEWRSFPTGDYIYGMARDVSSEKGSELEMQKKEARLSSIASILQLDAKDAQHLMEMSLNECNILNNSQYSAYYKYDSSSGCYNLSVSAGYNAGLSKQLPQSWHKSAQEGTPIIINNVNDNSGLLSLMAIPIDLGNHSPALLCQANRVQGYETSDAQDINVLLGVMRSRLERMESRDELRASEQKYRQLFENMTSGFALHKIICNSKNQPIDYAYLEVNPAFGKLTGIPAQALLGKRITEVMPETEDYWIQAFGKVALTGEPLHYTNYAKELGKHYETFVFSPQKNQFAVIFNDISERVIAQKSLLESENQFRSLVSNIPGCVYRCQPESPWPLLYMSEHALAITGYTAAEFMAGKITMAEIVHKDDEANRSKQAEEAIAKGLPFSIEYRIIDKHGNSKYILERGKAYYNAEGKAEWLDGITFDVTEQQNTKQERDKEQMLFSHGPIAMFVWAAEENLPVRYASINVEDVLGYKQSQFYDDGMYFSGILHPEDRLFFMQNTLLNRESLHSEFSCRIKIVNGEYRWFYVLAMPEKDENSHIHQVRGYIFDQSQLKTMERALINERQRLADIIEGANIGTWEWNVKTGSIIINERWAEIIGSSLAEIGDINFEQFMQYIHKVDQNYYKRLLDQHFGRELEYFDCECRLELPSNKGMIESHGHETIWINDRGKVTEWGTDGKPLIMSGTRADITARKNAEVEIIAFNNNLESVIRDRTWQLEQVNQDLESFAYSVSHDLRAPLRHIDGFMRLFYTSLQNPSEQANMYYGKVSAAVKRMSCMINDLLEFSRLGRKDLKMEHIELNELLTDIIDHLKIDISVRCIEWEISKIPTIMGDRGLVRIVFENLIGNAIKYTSNCSKARISISSTQSINGLIQIEVRDNGAGFDMAYASKLFGVFQRLHTSEEFEGTGIGLANVKQIVNRHGGSVRAEGEVGKGASFYVSFFSGKE